MIIISQDKEKIINFNNITQIYITQDEGTYYIRYETVDSLYYDLGIYATEERAKEILLEIAHTYKECIKLSRYGVNVINAVYEMPKE